MHYRNGREAKNGDKIVRIDPYTKQITSGILYDAVAGNDYCNGKMAVISNNDAMPNLKECLHQEDAMTLLTPTTEVKITDEKRT